ncbi:MAG: potassium channel family protein [Thermodesulfobacteriota bacterium]
MVREHRLAKILLLLTATIVSGVAGFMVIEGWPLLDALYMTIITLSTVGYRELYPLSDQGKIFVIVFIIMGVGAFLYIISTATEYFVSGYLQGAFGRRKMKKEIDRLKGHYIICGFGRVGEQVALEFAREKMPFVVLDNSPEVIQRCGDYNYLLIEGDASNDERLKEAGIMSAKGLVAATNSDADNVYVILSAKSLNPALFVVARANLEGAEHKLRKAGADRVLSPYSIGGRRLASLLLRPAVVEFLDVVMHSADIEFYMEEIFVHTKSSLVDATLGDARIKCVTGANILAIKKSGEERVKANPPTDTVIGNGDRLIALGTREQLSELEGIS